MPELSPRTWRTPSDPSAYSTAGARTPRPARPIAAPPRPGASLPRAGADAGGPDARIPGALAAAGEFAPLPSASPDAAAPPVRGEPIRSAASPAPASATTLEKGGRTAGPKPPPRAAPVVAAVKVVDFAMPAESGMPQGPEPDPPRSRFQKSSPVSLSTAQTRPPVSLRNVSGFRPPAAAAPVKRRASPFHSSCNFHCRSKPPLAIDSSEIYGSPRSHPSRCAVAPVVGQSPGTAAGAGIVV